MKEPNPKGPSSQKTHSKSGISTKQQQAKVPVAGMSNVTIGNIDHNGSFVMTGGNNAVWVPTSPNSEIALMTICNLLGNDTNVRIMTFQGQEGNINFNAAMNTSDQATLTLVASNNIILHNAITAPYLHLILITRHTTGTANASLTLGAMTLNCETANLGSPPAIAGSSINGDTTGSNITFGSDFEPVSLYFNGNNLHSYLEKSRTATAAHTTEPSFATTAVKPTPPLTAAFTRATTSAAATSGSTATAAASSDSSKTHATGAATHATGATAASTGSGSTEKGKPESNRGTFDPHKEKGHESPRQKGKNK